MLQPIEQTGDRWASRQEIAKIEDWFKREFQLTGVKSVRIHRRIAAHRSPEVVRGGPSANQWEDRVTIGLGLGGEARYSRRHLQSECTNLTTSLDDACSPGMSIFGFLKKVTTAVPIAEAVANAQQAQNRPC